MLHRTMIVLTAMLLVIAGAAAIAMPASATLAQQPGTLLSLAPTRILDTRHAVGGTEPGPNGDVHLQVDGVAGIPASGVSAVVINVTVTAPTAPGNITVFADLTTRPAASNLNFVAGQTVPNLVIAPVGTNGAVDLHNASTGSTQLVGDVSGYYLSGIAATPGAFTSTPPHRLLDTRHSLGGSAPGPQGLVKLTVEGAGGIPASGVSAVVLNVTVTGPTAPGYITVYADGSRRPTASNLNFVKGQTVPNLVIAPVGADGKADLYNGSAGTTQLIADVSGYYRSGHTSAAGAYTATDVGRVLDTRVAGDPAAPGPGGVVQVQVGGAGNTPPDDVTEVVLNVTVTSPTAPGSITAYADGAMRPLASNVNFLAGQTVPNLVVAPVSPDGIVDLYNGSNGKVQLIADVFGYYSAINNPWTPTALANRAAGKTDALNAVSCTSATACTGVGTEHDNASGNNYALIETLSGGNWTPTVLGLPAGDTQEVLNGVSCSSASACTAVGSVQGASTATPVAERLTSGSWTLTHLADPAGDYGSSISGVSCASATDCVAVGSAYETASGNAVLVVETLSGTTWTASSFAPPISTYSASLKGVSCTSATTCTAVGNYTDPSSGSFVPVGATWTGPALWTASTLPGPGYGLNAVSCSTATTCTAVGDGGTVDTLGSGTWTHTMLTLPGTFVFHLTGVNCATATDCTAVGGYITGRAGDTAPLTETLGSGTWTPIGLPPTSGSGDLYGISCTSVVSCTAVGNLYAPPATTQPLIETR